MMRRGFGHRVVEKIETTPTLLTNHAYFHGASAQLMRALRHLGGATAVEHKNVPSFAKGTR